MNDKLTVTAKLKRWFARESRWSDWTVAVILMVIAGVLAYIAHKL